jgi:hypothetical protein
MKCTFVCSVHVCIYVGSQTAITALSFVRLSANVHFPGKHIFGLKKGKKEEDENGLWTSAP